MVNPNPARITDPMWRLWTDRPNPVWKLGGIYVDFKGGYHNSVNGNLKNWPKSYSIKLPLDLVGINRNFGRAIDITMSDAEMRKITARMKRSALDPNDDRLAAVKEFFGTLDSKTVFGLTKNDADGPWRKASADKTHLWHLHMGIFTAFVNMWEMLAPILSVWRGETFAQWKASNMLRDFPKKGDTGEEIRYWQSIHNMVRETITPVAPLLKVDGDYGAATVTAFTFFARGSKSASDYVANGMSAWLAVRYHKALAVVSVPKTESSPVTDDQLRLIVNDWLNNNIPPNSSIAVTGDFKGRFTL